MSESDYPIPIDPNKPKILWMSNDPRVNTGYGTVTRNVVFRLRDKGYPIDVLSYYGVEGHTEPCRGVMIYPRLFHNIGRDAYELLIHHRRPDIPVALFDIWVTVEQNKGWFAAAHPYSTVYTPIDHTPMPPAIYHGCKDAYQTIAMAEYAYGLMAEAGLRPILIPHGVDTKIFKPLNRDECCSKLGIDPAWFVVGVNAANKGPRKRIHDMFAAYQKFVTENNLSPNDTRLYMNTDLRFPEGFDLKNLAGMMGIDQYIVITHPFARYLGTTDDQMAQFYNTLNILLNPSAGEGFGLPILEAEACGKPVIGTNFSSMPELISGHGWLVEPAAWEMTGLMTYQAIPDVNQIADALNESYQDEDKRRQFGAESRGFAQRYDYERVILPLWERYFTETFEKIGETKKT